MERDNLILIIRRKLAQGFLPTDGISRFWGAPANGEQCDACEEAISSTQVIMEGVLTRRPSKVSSFMSSVSPSGTRSERRPGAGSNTPLGGLSGHFPFGRAGSRCREGI